MGDINISITHLNLRNSRVLAKVIIILQDSYECHHGVLIAERIYCIFEVKLCSENRVGKKVVDPLDMFMTFFDPGRVSSIVASVQGVERVKDPFRDCTHCWERGEWVEGKGEK